MADDQSEWLKLPTDEKCVHKQWKARVAGYDEAIKLFNSLDEKSPEFTKFVGVLKKICTDNNAIAQEKGLDAVLAFVENAHIAGRTCGEVVSALVTKCLNAARAKTKEKAMEIILMYIEIDKHESVQEELMKGLENKQPKIVYGCVQALRAGLESFGPKVMTLKPIVKMLPTLLEDRDKTVREETKMLVVEVYRWIGAALQPQLANLKPVQVTELEAEFEKLPAGKPTQTRYMRSQQDLKAKAEAAAAATEAGEDGDGEADDDGGGVEVDPMDLIDPVEILSKLPKNFFEQIEAKKWQERKEMLEVVDKLVSENPKLLPGDYGELVRALKKVLSKDTNVMLVALAGKCICGLAKGLRKKFQSYATQCNEAILQKFKEKKAMVVTALREAIDAVYDSTTLEPLTEDIVTALNDKNPNIKAETASFLARCFSKATPTSLNKKTLKPFTELLSKTVNDTAPEVREASFDALGTAMKVVGEKLIAALLGEVDPLKMAKIKECCDKAVLVNVKGKAAGTAPAKAAPAPKAVASAKPAAAPAKPAAAAGKPAGGGPPKAGGAKKAAPGKKAAAGTAPGKGKAKPGGAGGAGGGDSLSTEAILSDEAVDEKANALFGEENVNNLASSNWKERLGSMEAIEQEIKRTPKEDMPTQAITRVLGAKKPGLKDNNFQVLKLRLSALAYLAENFNFTWTSAEAVLPDLVDKIGDVKNGSGCKEVLTAISEATDFSKVASEVVKIAFDGKNPKNQSECLNWLAQAIYDFGFKVNIKSLVARLKTALAATNPAVRQSAITLLGVSYMYMGTPLRTLFEDEKPALLSQIDAEFDKVKGQKPPAPVRGLKGLGDAGDGGGDEEGDDEEGGAVEDLLPRNDISDKISDALLEKLGDKNWKIRKEGLDEVTAILNEAKFITANLGGLPEALKHRLSDSNKILVNTTLGILKTIGTSSGAHCKRHVPVLAGSLISSMGDAKPMVRQAACSTLDAWVDETKLTPFVEDGVFAESLKIENPFLRSTLLNWLSPKLKDHQKKLPAEIKECCGPLLACLNDRNPDVRKAAQDAILPFMIHTGYDSMLKAASKVDKSSKDAVVALLEKAKGELPAPVQKAKSTPVVQSHISVKQIEEIMNDDEEEAPAATAAPSGSKKAAAAKSGGKAASGAKKAVVVKGKAAPASSRKKDVEIDTSPIMTITVSKAQRQKDEKALKILKWNFTAPRQEFVEQLREQMEKNFSSSIMEYLMHKDFQKHIVAIQMLYDGLERLTAETLANADLILKWFTLRFFETNPSMLNKGLEYLLALFELMAREEYRLSNMEAESFIPYLILKVGEAKDNVRKEVRKILQAICNVYPVSKMFLFVMGGLASKNAKQRTECLEELGVMMEKFGLEICQPSPKEALKEIAKQIADRDNSVRSAALNTIVVAYQIVGDQVYKYVGKLNDKDLGMLEERIKRAAKSKPVEHKPAPAAVTSATPTSKRGRPSTAPAPANVPAPQASVTNGVGLQRPSTAGTQSAARPQLPAEFTITTNWEPNLNTVRIAPTDSNLDELLEPFPLPKTMTKKRFYDASGVVKSSTAQLDQTTNAETAVTMTITNIASPDISLASSAIAQISLLLTEGKDEELLRKHVDQILIMIKIQLSQFQSKYLGNTSAPTEQVTELNTKCIGLLAELAEKNYLNNTAPDLFKDLFNQSILIIIDPRLQNFPDNSVIIQELNLALAKVIQLGSTTNVIVGVIRLLHDAVSPALKGSEQFIEFVQKCLWKITRGVQSSIVKMELNPVLEAVNSFLNSYPRSYWTTWESDKPLRSVKTLVSALVHNAPERVLTSVTLATYSPKSELEAYIQKNIARAAKASKTTTSSVSQIGETTQMNTTLEVASMTPEAMAKYFHNSLAAIFKKIGARENSKEGLIDLYNFREKHPEADLEPFLKRSSSFFQMYIQKGLHNIETERKQAAATATKDKSVDWDQRLKFHRERMKRLGIGNSASTSSIPNASSSSSAGSSKLPPDVVLSTRTSNVQDDSALSRRQEKTTSSTSADDNRAQLMELKARLDRIKKSSQM